MSRYEFRLKMLRLALDTAWDIKIYKRILVIMEAGLYQGTLDEPWVRKHLAALLLNRQLFVNRYYSIRFNW